MYVSSEMNLCIIKEPASCSKHTFVSILPKEMSTSRENKNKWEISAHEASRSTPRTELRWPQLSVTGSHPCAPPAHPARRQPRSWEVTGGAGCPSVLWHAEAHVPALPRARGWRAALPLPAGPGGPPASRLPPGPGTSRSSGRTRSLEGLLRRLH